MNNKGFTLIEVLAVIAIIAILGIVTVPGVLNSINNSKKASYNILIENIKEAGIRLFDEVNLAGNTIIVYNVIGSTEDTVQIKKENEYEYIDIPFQTLISNGFIKGVINKKETEQEKNNGNTLIITNPITEKDMGNCMLRIKKETDTNRKVTYTFLIPDEIATEQDTKTCPTAEEYMNGVK